MTTRDLRGFHKVLWTFWSKSQLNWDFRSFWSHNYVPLKRARWLKPNRKPLKPTFERILICKLVSAASAVETINKNVLRISVQYPTDCAWCHWRFNFFLSNLCIREGEWTRPGGYEDLSIVLESIYFAFMDKLRDEEFGPKVEEFLVDFKLKEVRWLWGYLLSQN